MTTSFILMVLFLLVTIGNAMLLGNEAEKINPNKKAIVSAILSLILSATCVVLWAADWRKETLKAYDAGTVKRETTYHIKSIDGEMYKADSTYTYKVIRK